MRRPLLRILPTGRAPSRRLLKACAIFGMAVRTHPPGDRRRRRATHAMPAAVRRAIDQLGPGGIAFLTGPSGSGKSTLLRQIAQCLAGAGHVPARLALRPLPERTLIDLFPGPLTGALQALADAGLADATLLPRSAGQISCGERWRLRLALAIHRRPAWLLIDEFASRLDRDTARAVAVTVRRWAHRTGARVVCASADGDLALALAPCVVIRTSLAAPPRVARRTT